MKFIHASLDPRKDTEHSFQLCGGGVNKIHANLGVHSELKGSFHSCETVERHLQCKERPRKQFLPLKRPCEAHACLFKG